MDKARPALNLIRNAERCFSRYTEYCFNLLSKRTKVTHMFMPMSALCNSKRLDQISDLTKDTKVHRGKLVITAINSIPKTTKMYI